MFLRAGGRFGISQWHTYTKSARTSASSESSQPSKPYEIRKAAGTITLLVIDSVARHLCPRGSVFHRTGRKWSIDQLPWRAVKVAVGRKVCGQRYDLYPLRCMLDLAAPTPGLLRQTSMIQEQSECQRSEFVSARTGITMKSSEEPEKGLDQISYCN